MPVISQQSTVTCAEKATQLTPAVKPLSRPRTAKVLSVFASQTRTCAYSTTSWTN